MHSGYFLYKDVLTLYTKGIKPVSTSIYINPPAWLKISAKNYDYLVLDKDATKHDVDLFLFSLFIYNNISFTDDPKLSILNLYNEISKNDGIVLGGGLMFFEGEKKILPSCCCGLEEWAETINDISNRRGVWLGHDPTPTIEYREHNIIMWSDDYSKKPKSDLVSIEFSVTELEYFLPQLRDDMRNFFEIPFYERLSEIDNNNYKRTISAVMAGFNVV